MVNDQWWMVNFSIVCSELWMDELFRDASENYGLLTLDCGLITASRPLFIFHF